MKKFAMAIVTTALLSSAQADSCASNFSGFYTGVQAGINSTTGNLKIDGYAVNPDANPVSNYKATTGSKAFLGGLFTGYGMGVGSCAYVGGEVYVNFANDKNTMFDTSSLCSDARTFKITAKQNLAMGAKIRLGYTFSPKAMVFLGLGLEYAKWQLKCENITPSTVLAQVGIDTETKKHIATVAFAPSLGMEAFLTKNIFVRGEYTYVVGTNQKLAPQQVTTRVPAKITADVKANLDQQRFTIGLGYKF